MATTYPMEYPYWISAALCEISHGSMGYGCLIMGVEIPWDILWTISIVSNALLHIPWDIPSHGTYAIPVGYPYMLLKLP